MTTQTPKKPAPRRSRPKLVPWVEVQVVDPNQPPFTTVPMFVQVATEFGEDSRLIPVRVREGYNVEALFGEAIAQTKALGLQPTGGVAFPESYHR